MTTISKSSLIDTVTFLDPGGSTSEKNKAACESAIVTVSQDTASRIFVQHTWSGRVDTEQLFEKCLQIHKERSPKVFGIESNAAQIHFVNGLIIYARERGLSLPIHPHKQPNTINKIFRIRSILQPVISQGRLFLMDEMKDLKNQIKNFPMSKLLDLIDALASAVSLLPNRMNLVGDSSEKDSRLQYLRDTGAPMSYIEKVAREYDILDSSISGDAQDYISRLRAPSN